MSAAAECTSAEESRRLEVGQFYGIGPAYLFHEWYDISDVVLIEHVEQDPDAAQFPASMLT